MAMSDLFMKQRIFWSCCLILSFVVIVASDTSKDHEDASFYGESYIVTPVEDANSSTSITLDFRTHRPHGLLFLAAGETDYVLIQLNNGIMETRVNLGSGEAIVFSARGVRLDDSRWHRLVVNRTLDTVYVNIDGIGQGQGSTPGPYHNLNVDLGVFMGGSGSLKKDVYRNAKSFRGCLRDVFYNGLSVLQEARDMKSSRNAFQVMWHCDDEFFAPSDSDISFSSDTAYVAFPHLRIYPSTTSVLSCEFRTRSADAILIFNSGRGKSWEDFLAVELVEGRTKLSVDKGSGVIEVYLAQLVNDGEWHRLEVSLSQTVAQLKVDGLSNVTRFNLGGQNILNLANYMYVGGVSYTARPLAIKLGLTSVQGKGIMKGSLLGCVRNVQMNSRSYGFQQIEMSRLIHPECGWDFPCANNPCLPGASCVELEGPEFRCDCNQQVCVKDKFKSMSLERNRGIDGILSIQKLYVVAKSEKVINESNIKLNLNILNSIGRDDAVVFTLVEQPKLGTFLQGRSRLNSFSLKDLKMNKIVYRQDMGSSDFDSAVFQVTFDSITRNGESKLKDKYEFVLPIQIVKKALSTKPIQLVLGYGNLITITHGARIKITSSVMDVKDSTVDPAKLRFEIKFLRTARSRFERISGDGRSLTSFTYRELLDGSIWFVHGGDQIVYTTVAVTDGVSASNVVNLRFKLEQLKINIVNNTGLLLDYGSSHLITSHNLSCVANSKVEKIELVYHITRSVSHGATQRLDIDTDQWMDVESFTQVDINSGLIRYIHLPGETVASFDELWIEVLAKDVKTSPFYFNIRFKTVTLYVDHEFDLYLHQILFAKLTSNYLSVKSNAESLDFSKIVFTVHRPPQKGFLYNVRTKDVDLSYLQQARPLRIDDTFTQLDVNNGDIYYRIENPTDQENVDYLDLHASYFGFTIMVRNRIVYLPTKLDILIINEGLEGVAEGGFKVITEDMLAVDMDDFARYTFSVIRRPQHGAVNIIDPLTSATQRLNTSYFSMVEILDRQVIYLHDDSEHNSDSFTFSVIPVIKRDSEKENEEIREITGTFHIKITMRNDNAPIRTVNKVFHVVTGQSRHLTSEDLAFNDPDINFDSSQLFYQTQSIPNGELIRASTRERVFNFTQKDLEENNLLFQHRGESYGRAPLLVSDGKYFSNGLIEIQASSPYVKTVDGGGVEVRKGQSVVISSQNLIVESNLDFDPTDILFEIVDGPKFGYVRVRGRKRKTFTYQDVKNDLVVYVNGDGESEEDFFKFSVSLKSIKNESNVYITIRLDGIDDPPAIIHNKILEVTAHHTQKVTDNYLHVGHKAYADDEIEFIVTKLPERGYLTVKGKREKLGSAPEFTQQDINDRLITYTSESSEISFDSFVFDVSTEHESLRNMEFLISIIPQMSHINKANITVLEGGTLTIPLSKLSLNKQLVRGKLVNIVVVNPPIHGQILLQEGTRQNPVRSFPISSLSQGLVSYRHDDSETSSDQFSLRTQSSPSSSSSSSNDLPINQETSFYVTVTPVDDQPPKVITNTGLHVWTGSLTLLTDEQLKATDPDSPLDAVRFRVVASPSNGHLAYLNNTFRSILSFSQSDVDSCQIVFVHTGAESGDFGFQATDGQNSDRTRTFYIQAKQVKILLPSNNPVFVFPNILQPITNSTLLATTSTTNYTHPIIYNILHPFPAKGRVVSLASGRLLEVKTFSQDDVNQNKIFFQPTKQMRSWEELDSISIEISSTYATPLHNKKIPVQISFSNLNSGNYKKLLGIKSPSVPEGEQITITREHFDSTQLIQRINSFRSNVKVEFSFVTSVSHGSLWFKEMDAVMGGVFTQEEINRGDLIYNHDHTDTIQDMFQFAAKIMVPRQTSTFRPPFSNVFNFTVDIQPVNDKGFELLTRHSRIQVTQGLEVKVTSRNLSTIDLDTGPEGIEYIILKQPEHGKFVRASSPSTRIDSFTQEEINNGDIIFKHDGSPHSGDTMNFKVWDGKFHPIYSIMHIDVTPITIQVSDDKSVSITQGQRSVALSNDQLKVSTNGDFMALEYTVTQQPQCGKLMKGNSLVTKFTQGDVKNGNVVYLMDTDSPGDDFFVCDIHLNYLDSSLDVVQFDIVVKPLIRQGPLLSSAGSHVAITRASLDASELAQLTNDNPRFDITSPPRYGQVMLKTNRQRRNIDAQKSKFSPVSSFTFEDVFSTRIYFVADAVSKTEDRFSYTLSAKGVPPARGEFVIQLDPTDTQTTKPDKGIGDGRGVKDSGGKFTDFIIPVSTSPSFSEGRDDEKKERGKEVVKGAAIGPGDEDDNTAMIIGVVISFIVLIIIVVVLVIVFVRWRRRRLRQSDCHPDKSAKPRPYISGPLQLQQPHVFIEPHSDNDDSPVREEDTALMTPHNKNDNLYVNTSHINNSHDISDTGQWVRDHDSSVTKTSPVFRQMSGSNTNTDEADEDSEMMVGGRGGGGRGSNTSGDLIEWTLMDPDLLQHCYNSQPVLRNNQYWL